MAGLKPKDLVGMPWRVAFALQADGWWLRSDIVWSKPNPMPESVADRPTKSHEYLFLMAKSERYFYDIDAIRERSTWAPDQTGQVKIPGGWDIEHRSHGTIHAEGRTSARYKTVDAPHAGGRRQAPEPGEPNAFHPLGRNKRTVWEIATQAFPQAHFATFPEALVEPCIAAGTSEHGCCATCGAPWARITDVEYVNPGNRTTNGPRSLEHRHSTTAGFEERRERVAQSTGWVASCTCGSTIARSVVLDPFAGSGTALLVAQRMGRSAIGIDLSEPYCALAKHRLQGVHGQQKLKLRT